MREDWSEAKAVKKQQSLSQDRKMFGHFCGLDSVYVFLWLQHDYGAVYFLSCSIMALCYIDVL